MILNYKNLNVKIENINNICIYNLNDYYKLINMLNSNSCLINNNIVPKNFKIYNFCSYEFNNTCRQIKKNSLLYDYLILKIRNIKEINKTSIYEKLVKILEKINSEISINNYNITTDIDNLFYNLLLEQEINLEELSMGKMLNYIIKNTDNNYIIVYDSDIINPISNKNVIKFNVNRNINLKDYNLIISNSDIYNINIDIITDNFYNYWPLVIGKNELYNYINNNFINILSKKNLYSYEENSVILGKLINYFYDKKIEIKYFGKDKTIQKFLSSSVKN